MENSSFDNFDLQLNEAGRSFLRTIGKWAMFLSIVGFIFIGLMLVFAFAMFSVGALGSAAMGGAFGAIGGGFLGAMYLIIAVLYFFPVLYLFQFSSRIKRAFAENDSVQLNDALESLKSHYKFVGIFTIIFLSLYILIIFFAIVAGITGAMM